jgi:hypothetical protein
MQPAKNISRRKRLIVLHEPFPNSEVDHNSFVIALQKETTGIPEDFGIENQESTNWGKGCLHESGSIIINIMALDIMTLSSLMVIRTLLLKHLS